MLLNIPYTFRFIYTTQFYGFLRYVGNPSENKWKISVSPKSVEYDESYIFYK